MFRGFVVQIVDDGAGRAVDGDGGVVEHEAHVAPASRPGAAAEVREAARREQDADAGNVSVQRQAHVLGNALQPPPQISVEAQIVEEVEKRSNMGPNVESFIVQQKGTLEAVRKAGSQGSVPRENEAFLNLHWHFLIAQRGHEHDCLL